MFVVKDIICGIIMFDAQSLHWPNGVRHPVFRHDSRDDLQDLLTTRSADVPQSPNGALKRILDMDEDRIALSPCLARVHNVITCFFFCGDVSCLTYNVGNDDVGSAWRRDGSRFVLAPVKLG